MTTRDLISEIKEDLKANRFDEYIPDEYIYWKAISIADLLIKRESDTRKIFSNTRNFEFINCFEMEEEDINFCGIPLSCNTICKSVKKLPETFISNTGSILIVSNPLSEIKYDEVTPTRYNSIMSKEYKPKKRFYWIQDGYLIVPNYKSENCSPVLKIMGMFKDLERLLEVKEDTVCGKIFDLNFPIPSYLEGTLKDLVSKDILSKRFRIVQDENTNMNSNLK